MKSFGILFIHQILTATFFVYVDWTKSVYVSAADWPQLPAIESRIKH